MARLVFLASILCVFVAFLPGPAQAQFRPAPVVPTVPVVPAVPVIPQLPRPALPEPLPLPAPLPAPVATPAPVIAPPPPQACRARTASECASEATACLAGRSLSRQYDLEWIEGRPRILRSGDYPTEQQQEDAADCSSDLNRCLVGGC